MTGKRKMPGWAWLLIVGIVILIGALVRKPERPETPTPATESELRSTEIEAFVFSQMFVNRLLKTPSTPKFPHYREATVSKLAPDSYRIEAWVDTQNMFGAMVRNPYTCELHREGKTWYLDDLRLTPQ